MTIFEKAVQLVDRATQIPGKISDFGDDLNDKVIKLATDLQNAKNQSVELATGNLKETKIKALGTDAAQWLSNPRNLLIVVGTVAAVVTILWRVKK